VRNEPNLAGRLGPGGRNMRNKPNRPAGSGPGVEEHGCDYAKQDACDRSRGVVRFAINLDFIWIYIAFGVDRSGAGFML
jgi:hypothetical protein